MNDPSPLRSDAASHDSGELSPEARQSALFAQLVIQQSNLAMMLLGKGPLPEGSQPVRDLEAAQLFIDQLEALAVKTRGNLNPHEEALVKQTLMALRLAFVEAVGAKPEPAPPPAASPEAASTANAPAAPAESAEAADEEASRRRFSKKY